MVSSGDIDRGTQVVLANAAYLNGQWLSRFNTSNTQWSRFYTDNQKVSFVQMMNQRDTFLINEDFFGAKVLHLPYLTSNKEVNFDISMVIILPPSGTDALEKVLSKLNAESLESALEDTMFYEIDVALPKFELEQQLDLVPILREMGVKKIFDSSANFSDFSPDQNIMFGRAKHMAKIKVNEEGSTASAATIAFTFRLAYTPLPFICDHPFVFLIYDRESKAILFTGISRDP